MDRLLGMRIFPKRKTDDEWIEEARRAVERYDRRGLWMYVFQASLGALQVVVAGWLAKEMIEKVGQLQNPPLPGGPGIRLALAVTAGFLLGSFGWAGVKEILEAISGAAQIRMQRLLVRYHDAYHALSAEPQEANDPQTETTINDDDREEGRSF